jgi:hypothetical protein
MGRLDLLSVLFLKVDTGHMLHERYYMRVSGHSIRADHSSLRRLFFPEYHSRLELYFRTVEEPPVITTVWLHNRGPGTAEDVSVLFKTQRIAGHHEPERPWARIKTAWTDESGARLADFFRFERSLHPGEMVKVHTFQLEQNIAKLQRPIVEPLNRFAFELYARNEPPIKIEYSLVFEHIGAGNQSGIIQEI